MTLTTLAQSEHWMTPHERDLNQELIRAIATFLAASGVPENALVVLRVNDVASTWLLARRLESALAPADGVPAPCPTPAQANAIGKCRERLRKAIKELEEHCAKTGTPAPTGFVEQMQRAVQEVRAAGIIGKNGFPINHDGEQDTEGQAPEPPDSDITAPDTRHPAHSANLFPPTPSTLSIRRGESTPSTPSIPPHPQPPQDTG